MNRRATLAALAVGALAVTGLAVSPSKADDSASSTSSGLVLSAIPILNQVPSPTPAMPVFARRPNVLMITSDDLSTLDLAYMPHVKKLMADEGVTFSNAIAPTPICVPSRASLLSGQYAHNDGADTISGPHGGFKSFDEQDTIATALRGAGYRTYFAGKYLNGYGKGRSRHYVPPGWTDWRATVDPTTYRFFSPILNVDGRLVRTRGYTTSVMNKQANELISKPGNARHPWFAWVNYVAPHFGGPVQKGDPRRLFRGTRAAIKVTVPAPRDVGRFDDVPLPHRLDMFYRHTGDLPAGDPATRKMGRRMRHALRIEYDRRLEAAQSIDRAVASQIATLRRTHQLKNTIVIFDSDNGYVTGEHNIRGKLWHYNEILRIPLMMRGPDIPRDKVVSTEVTVADLTATILGAAQTGAQRPLDGVDILPWLRGPAQVRVVPIEGWSPRNGRHQLYTGVRVGPYTYVRFRTGGEELYDRDTDPYELHNLAYEDESSALVEQFRKLTGEYADCAGNSCPKAFYPVARISGRTVPLDPAPLTSGPAT